MDFLWNLLIVVLFVIMAYYVDKFMGLGMFKRKDPNTGLLMTKEDRNHKLTNDYNRIYISAPTNRKVKGMRYVRKPRILTEVKNLNTPHQVVTNFVNKLYNEKRDKNESN